MAGIIAAKDVITDAVGRAVELAAGYSRGQVIPWVQIEAAGFPRDHTHYPAFSRRFRAAVRSTRGINMHAVPGVGLKLLTLEEDVNTRSLGRRRRASRQLWRDSEELRAIPDAELPEKLKDMKYRRIDGTRVARRKVLQAERIAAALAMVKPAVRGLYAKPAASV